MPKRKKATRSKSKKRNKSIKTNILRAILVFVLLLLILAYLSFRSWKSNHIEEVLANSQTIYTELGPIEYKSIGKGPVILLSHMGGSGSDNIKLFQRIADKGYRIVTPSRPGYLNTPLSEKANVDFIADQYALLLQKLNIKEKVFVMGVSAGGPSAIEFAAKYPNKCKGLILHSAISKHFSPLNKMRDYSQLINIMLSPIWQDPFAWINYKGSEIHPRYFIQEILERGTTLNHKKTKELAKEITKNNNNNINLLLFNSITSPMSIRSNGLENDIKNAETFKAKKIKVPVLITHSKIDKVVDVFHAENLKKQLPQAELYTYQGYGHAFWFGKEWSTIKNKTLAFLKKHNQKSKAKTKTQSEVHQSLFHETWVSNNNGSLLKMNTDFTFNLDFPAVDDKTYIRGSFKIEDNIISFKANESENYCRNIIGKYKYSIKNNKLSLTPIYDNCFQRKDLFTSGWFKL